MTPYAPLDYLVIGHVAKDLTPQGYNLGGTVAYAGLTACAWGLRVGVVTAASRDCDFTPLQALTVKCDPSPETTYFENRYTSAGRLQRLRARAVEIGLHAVPREWMQTPLVHLGPIANEVDLALVEGFPHSFLAITPQGWLRRSDEGGRITASDWRPLIPQLRAADAVVLSTEDLQGDARQGRAIAAHCTILALTAGRFGAYIFWQGQERHFPAPSVEEEDLTGAGDVFAATFFIHVQRSGDPWSAARLANHLAARSVTRRGLEGTPSAEEIHSTLKQVKV